MRLIIVRHAETEENIKKITMGQLGGHLTERGRGQAKLVAEALKNEKIDAAYTSDLRRTRETALEIMKYHPETELKDEKLLRERDFGKLNGTNADGIFKDMTSEEFRDFKPEGGENAHEMCERTIKFYKGILKEHENDTVLVVTHAGNIQELLMYILKQVPERYSELGTGNTSITIVKTEEGKTVLKKFNSMEHLKL
jgi:broad specificity phosphatase PhoE